MFIHLGLINNAIPLETQERVFIVITSRHDALPSYRHGVSTP